ncbi:MULTISPECIES: hypothetical protein [Prauserella salsuginis group]|uniref:Uncharacterized protein n=1 Tax=Prauserella salsuginis TaxID=387889 RepID=A0ABW6G9R1_9PSEU|nr:MULTISPECIES: hypothetical protein [Prauserella salsuginis group]
MSERRSGGPGGVGDERDTTAADLNAANLNAADRHAAEPDDDAVAERDSAAAERDTAADRDNDPGESAVAAAGGESVAAHRRGWWKRSKRWHKAAVLGGAGVVTAAVAGFVVVAMHNSSAPADAVRDYVETIARGDAAAANRMVDPATFPGRELDRSLLTDAVLGSADRLNVEEIEVEEINGEPAGSMGFSPDDAIAEVHVSYVIDGAEERRGEATLRARLAESTLGVWEHWTVIDPLVVPAYLETSLHRVDGVAGMAGATIGGAHAPANAPGADPVNRTYVLLYPGVYTVRGVASRYFTSEPETLVAVQRSWDGDQFWEPADHTPPHGLARIGYDETPELLNAVSAEMERELTACAEAVPDPLPRCPHGIAGYSEMTGATIDRFPEVRSLGLAQSGGGGPPQLWLHTESDGLVDARLSDGTDMPVSFFVSAKVRIDEAGEVSVRLSGW